GLATQAVRVSDRSDQPRLPCRHLVDSAERSQAHELRSELSDAFQQLQLAKGFVARQRAQAFGVQRTRERGITQRVQVLDLSSKEAGKGLELDHARWSRKHPEPMTVTVHSWP